MGAPWEIHTLHPVEAWGSTSCLNLGEISQFTPNFSGYPPKLESPGSQG